jgi:hypothetical protein
MVSASQLCSVEKVAIRKAAPVPAPTPGQVLFGRTRARWRDRHCPYGGRGPRRYHAPGRWGRGSGRNSPSSNLWVQDLIEHSGLKACRAALPQCPPQRDGGHGRTNATITFHALWPPLPLRTTPILAQFNRLRRTAKGKLVWQPHKPGRARCRTHGRQAMGRRAGGRVTSWRRPCRGSQNLRATHGPPWIGGPPAQDPRSAGGIQGPGSSAGRRPA